MVVMAVAIGTGTLAINFSVLFVAEIGTGKAMRGAEMGANREVGFHRISVIIGPEFWMFKELNAAEG